MGWSIRYSPLIESPAVAASTVALVGTNTERSVMNAAWVSAGVGALTETLFGSYSGGTFVPGYGTHGCYAICGTGGHGPSHDNVDAFIFDFADYTWRFLPNTNGVATHPSAYSLGECTQSAFGTEVTGSVVPAPGHTYRIPIGVNSDVYMPVMQYQTTAAAGTDWLHRCRLNWSATAPTCTWSRAATNATGLYWGASGDNEWYWSVYDAARDRLWMLATLSSINRFPNCDVATGTWTTNSIPTGLGGSGSGGSMIHDPVNDCLWMAPPGGGNLYRLNLSNAGVAMGGWTVQSFTDAAAMRNAEFSQVRWHLYPAADGGDNCLYTYTSNGQNRLKKFDPATRTFSWVTIANGSSIPSWLTGSSGYNYHYSRFCYVPSRRCFAFIAGNGQQVALLRP